VGETAGDWIWLDVEADGFLYNMVRAIAGTLLNVGRGYWPESEVAAILASGDRTRAGPTAPARGLFLMRVRYDER
jgi:tRNA pseudouridine38-40 synthase